MPAPGECSVGKPAEAWHTDCFFFLMEEKIVTWSVAVFVAGFVALIIHGCVMTFFDEETIREAAVTGVLAVSLGVLATFLTG